MKLLETIKQRISSLSGCEAAYILAHASWSACDHRKFSGPSALQTSSALDSSNQELVWMLYAITSQADYSNNAQAAMLRWLNERGYTSYVAKQLKTTKKKLVDWE